MQAADAAPAEIGREPQAHRAAADDEYGNLVGKRCGGHDHSFSLRRATIGAKTETLKRAPVDSAGAPFYGRRLAFRGPVMKIANSLKSLKKRDKNCRIVRRKGRVYVINKVNPRFKARQG